eukprot:3516775-Rhodomonas_salina.1
MPEATDEENPLKQLEEYCWATGTAALMVDTDESVEAIRPEGETDHLQTLVLIRQRMGTGFQYARVEGAKRNPIMDKVLE